MVLTWIYSNQLNHITLRLLLASAVKNLPLIKYSFDQVIMTKEGCMNHLRTFYPEARDEDWQVIQLVNVCKLLKILKRMVKDLSIGTEVVNSERPLSYCITRRITRSINFSISSTRSFRKNFPEYAKDWEPKIKKMIPSYGESLIDDVQLMRKIRKQTSKDLELDSIIKQKKNIALSINPY